MAADHATWQGRTVLDNNGQELGELQEIYRSREDDSPTWGVLSRARLGHEALVPLAGASEEGASGLRVAASEDEVRSSPRFAPKDGMSPEVEERLHRHYSGGGTRRTGAAAAPPSGNGSGDQQRKTGRDVVVEARERQHEEFGGFKLGAAFFGWLVAIGLGALLTAVLSAAGTAIGLTELTGSEAQDSAGTIGIVGGALFLLVLMVAYYAGGYVAGRLSRFDGARQGLGTWLFGLAVTLLLAAAGAIFGSEYNVLAKLNLPRLPVDEGSLATGGLIALAAILLGTLLAAIVGGKAGERFHKKVDRAGFAAT